MTVVVTLPSRFVKGRNVFLRGTIVDLRTVLQELDNGVQHLHIYCHSLQYNNPTTAEDGIVTIVVPGQSNLRSLTVFSCFVLDDAKFQGFSIESHSRFKLKLLYEHVPEKFSFLCNGKQYDISRGAASADVQWLLDDNVSAAEAKVKQDCQLLDIERGVMKKGAAGFEFIVSNDAPKVLRIDAVSNGEFQRAKVHDSDENFDLSTDSCAFGNLALLLNSLFSEACDLVFKGLADGSGRIQAEYEQKSMYNLSFIQRCTNNCPDYSTLRDDAETLLSRLKLPRQSVVLNEEDKVGGYFFVPTQNYSRYYKSLTDVLGDCEAVQNGIAELLAEQRLTKEIREVGTASLDAVARMGEGVISNEDNYGTALSSIERVSGKRQEMAVRKDDIIKKHADFVKGFDEYKIMKKEQRDMALLMGAGEIVVALVVALATNPAAIIPTVADIALAVKDVILDEASSAVTTGSSEPIEPGKEQKPKLEPKPKVERKPSVWLQPKPVDKFEQDRLDHMRSREVEPIADIPKLEPRPKPKPDLKPRAHSAVIPKPGPDPGLKPRTPSVVIIKPGPVPRGLFAALPKPGPEPDPGPGVHGAVVPKPASTGRKPGEKSSKKLDNGTSKPEHVAKSVFSAAKSAGPTMWKAYMAYENNPILKGKAEAGQQQQIADAMKKSASEASEVITNSSPPIDYFGLLADWDEIVASVDMMFATLKLKLAGETIRGFEEYRAALTNMVARGRALIHSQRQLQQDIQAFYRGAAEMKLREARSREVQAIAASLSEKPMALWAYLDDFRASYVVMYRLLMLNMHRCILSLKYRYSRDNSVSVKISPYLSIKEVNDAVRKLDEVDLKKAGGVVHKQTLPLLEIRTDENETHGIFVDEDWKTVLLAENKIHFNIPPDFSDTNTVYDVRILDISAEFFNANQEPFSKVEYEVYIGPGFVDRDSTGKVIQYYTTHFSITKKDKQGSWKFATASEESASCKPALFGPGYIYFNPTKKIIKLEDVANVVLTMTVEGVGIQHDTN